MTWNEREAFAVVAAARGHGLDQPIEPGDLRAWARVTRRPLLAAWLENLAAALEQRGDETMRAVSKAAIRAAEDFLQTVGNHCLKQGEGFAWHIAMHTGLEAMALREALDAFYQKERKR